jgi:mRNA interferase MazF
MQIQRGDIYLVDFEPSKSDDPSQRQAEQAKAGSEVFKIRPAVVISINALNRGRRTVVVVPLSSSPRVAPPLVVSVPSAGENSTAVCDQITAVNKATRLKRKLGTLSAQDMLAIEQALGEILRITKR